MDSHKKSPSPPLLPIHCGRSDMECQLQQEEEGLGETINDLQRRQRKAVKDGSVPLPCDHAQDEWCVAHAFRNFCQSFLLSYGARVGTGILLRAFKLTKKQSFSSLLDLKKLVSEKDLIVREEACRIGLLAGGFTGSYHALRCFLRKFRRKETPLNVIVAGSVAGLSVLALSDLNQRRTLALYLLARLGQCAYNSAKSTNKFHLRGSRWRHGDSFLFALSAAQIMYAFIMCPESLRKSYYEFLLKNGPLALPVYRAVRDRCRGDPVDVASLLPYLSNKEKARHVRLEEFPSVLPCSLIHTDTNSCLAGSGRSTLATFRKLFPLQLSVTFVPYVLLHLQNFMDAPSRTCWLALTDAIRSTSFLSAYVGIFQGLICLHRKVASKDHELVYWVVGGMAAITILLEKKPRRAELALYVLPQAASSLWYIVENWHLLPNINNAEVALFCACMGGIMYYLEHEPETMAPFLRGLIRRFLACRISNPTNPPLNPTDSYSYLQTLNAMNKKKMPESAEADNSPHNQS